MRHAVTMLCVCLSWTACRTPPPPVDADPNAPALIAFAPERVPVEAAALLDRVGASAEVRTAVLARLDELMHDRDFASRLQNPGVNAIAAFRYGSGGFIFEGGGGEGVVSFAGGQHARPIQLEGWSVGAVAGGENGWGVLLGVGLRHADSFADRYTMRQTAGTIGTTGYRSGFGEPVRGRHHIHLVGTAVGAKAEAGAGHLDIRFAGD